MNETIDFTILMVLSNSGQYLVPEDTLTAHVRMKLRPRPLHSDVQSRIEHLDSTGRIVGVSGEYGRKFKLSELGEAWLKENA